MDAELPEWTHAQSCAPGWRASWAVLLWQSGVLGSLIFRPFSGRSIPGHVWVGQDECADSVGSIASS